MRQHSLCRLPQKEVKGWTFIFWYPGIEDVTLLIISACSVMGTCPAVQLAPQCIIHLVCTSPLQKSNAIHC